MKLVFFVKDGCGACRNAKEKVDFFLEKWEAAGTVEIETISLSTSDGLVEAAMRAVADIPTIILEDDDGEVVRWVKKAPTSDELRASLGVA